PMTTAMTGAHLLVSLSEDPISAITLMAGRAAFDSLFEQSWFYEMSTVSIDGDVGSPVLNGRDHVLDTGHSWAMLLPSLAADVGLPGATVSLGPGGDVPVDTHLSRAGKGRLSVNGGAGEVELNRIVLTPPAPEAVAPPPGTGAALFLSDGDALSIQTADGSVRPVSGGAALTLPLPCAFSAPVGPPATVAAGDSRVMWLPLPI